MGNADIFKLANQNKDFIALIKMQRTILTHEIGRLRKESNLLVPEKPV